MTDDKIEGLTADLRCAVQVAWRRGAKDWARLNYPQWVEWLESCDAETVAALSSRPVDDTGGEFSGVNPEAVAWRARFVTSTDGREWSDWVYEEGPYLGGLDPQANDIQPLYTAPPPITGEGVRG